jgi:hypothetical protein
MANPNRCMAQEQRRVNNTAYDCFPNASAAAQFAAAARADGFKVKETRFRIGPRGGNRHSYRVSVYWKVGEAGPDMMKYRAMVNR